VVPQAVAASRAGAVRARRASFKRGSPQNVGRHGCAHRLTGAGTRNVTERQKRRRAGSRTGNAGRAGGVSIDSRRCRSARGRCTGGSSTPGWPGHRGRRYGTGVRSWRCPPPGRCGHGARWSVAGSLPRPWRRRQPEPARSPAIRTAVPSGGQEYRRAGDPVRPPPGGRPRARPAGSAVPCRPPGGARRRAARARPRPGRVRPGRPRGRTPRCPRSS